MPDREKYIKVLSKTVKTVKEYNEDAPIKISLECVEDILELLKEQERIIKLYEKAEPFLHSHGWDWTQVEGWVKQEEALKSEEKTNA